MNEVQAFVSVVVESADQADFMPLRRLLSVEREIKYHHIVTLAKSFCWSILGFGPLEKYGDVVP